MNRYLFLFLVFVRPIISFSQETDQSTGDRYTPAPPRQVPPSYAVENRGPTYPTMSKRLGEQGTVILRVLVTAGGNSGVVEIKESSGFERLDTAAVEAVRSWTFNPATVNGKPIDEWYLIKIPFKLVGTDNQTMPALASSSECSSNATSWEKVFDDENIFVNGIQKKILEPKGIIDRAKQLLSKDATGRIFKYVKNDLRRNNEGNVSLLSIRIADCVNNEIFIDSEAEYSCSFGSGKQIAIQEVNATHIKKWIKISDQSKESKLVQYVCSDSRLTTSDGIKSNTSPSPQKTSNSANQVIATKTPPITNSSEVDESGNLKNSHWADHLSAKKRWDAERENEAQKLEKDGHAEEQRLIQERARKRREDDLLRYSQLAGDQGLADAVSMTAKDNQGRQEGNSYARTIAGLIKSHTLLPKEEIKGNPAAEFMLDLLPDGNLKHTPRLTRSSGSAAFDLAVLRAIEKSAPFPPDPKTGEVPSSISLSYRPKETERVMPSQENRVHSTAK